MSPAAADQAVMRMEEGGRSAKQQLLLTKEVVNGGDQQQQHHHHQAGRTAHNMSSSSLRKKSDLSLVWKVRCGFLRSLLANLQQVLLGTKLLVLFPTVPLAVAAQSYNFGVPWVFSFSLLGLIPLAERVSFLTEQVAYYTGPTVGGLLNATCGNATELIIALLALRENKIEVVKWSLLGSVLSNLLLVLGSSLFLGGLANLRREQLFDRKQADVNSGMLLLGILCLVLPHLFGYVVHGSGSGGARPAMAVPNQATLSLSRACSVIMLLAYVAYLFFQLKTHRQLFESQDEGGGDDDDDVSEDKPEIGFTSAMTWLISMTVVISLLSELVVGTIEGASESWGLSLSFISVILLPIVGNAAEHAGAIIFAFKNKLDITLGVALGSSTQITMFVVPLSVMVAWAMGAHMDMDFHLMETASLLVSILVAAFALQDGSSHYMKGIILLLCYVAIGSCFFVLDGGQTTNMGAMHLASMAAAAVTDCGNYPA